MAPRGKFWALAVLAISALGGVAVALVATAAVALFDPWRSSESAPVRQPSVTLIDPYTGAPASRGSPLSIERPLSIP
ncbi:MAG: hypothetical protein GX605_08680 [Chloroflexi bacterium]|nr:hypothetical protein [Chloroflexota bacterium]